LKHILHVAAGHCFLLQALLVHKAAAASAQQLKLGALSIA